MSTIGKEIATYFVDGTGTLTATQAGGAGTDVTLTAGTFSQAMKVSSGTTLQTGAAGFTATPTSTNWCVGLTNTSGSQQTFKYSAAAGLATGSCP